MVSLKGKTYEEIYGKEEARKKKDKLRILMIERDWVGERSPNWKGDEASLIAIHEWVRYNKPKPKKCVHCGLKEPIDLSNISGKYLRNLDDYEWLCRRCHMVYDERIKPKKTRPCNICGKQTANKKYCSHNCHRFGSRKIKNRPSKEELVNLLKQSNFVQVGKKFGVSDNTIRKWINKGVYFNGRISGSRPEDADSISASPI